MEAVKLFLGYAVLGALIFALGLNAKMFSDLSSGKVPSLFGNYVCLNKSPSQSDDYNSLLVARQTDIQSGDRVMFREGRRIGTGFIDCFIDVKDGKCAVITENGNTNAKYRIVPAENIIGKIYRSLDGAGTVAVTLGEKRLPLTVISVIGLICILFSAVRGLAKTKSGFLQ